jgi:epoxyqueuosine reductase
MLSRDAIIDRARALGFDLCGISRAERHPRLSRINEWIAQGRAGTMTWLVDSVDERLDPRQVLPTARSVISVAVVYNTANAVGTAVAEDTVTIARYARGVDYHDVLRSRLRALLRWMAEEHGPGPPGLEALSCVDTEPIQERVFAEAAGLGWIGKNTCVINPQLGSWLFLGEILTNVELEPDVPSVDQCGSCTRCIEACPTGAIVEPYVVDATRCLSYLTIEVRGEVDESLRPAIHNEVYGCDICQDVCPWNRRAAESTDPVWQAREPLAAPTLIALCRMTDDAWRQVLKGSAMRRAGLRGIRRSLAYAASHLPPGKKQDALDALTAHETAALPDVEAAVAWASRGPEA